MKNEYVKCRRCVEVDLRGPNPVVAMLCTRRFGMLNLPQRSSCTWNVARCTLG